MGISEYLLHTYILMNHKTGKLRLLRVDAMTMAFIHKHELETIIGEL